jgi:trk system potassium uptake protein TrkA
MKVFIAGGGSVGVAIAEDLADRHHEVVILEQRGDVVEKIREQFNSPNIKVEHCDACEFNSLQKVGLRSADVIIAATGDDEDNLVVSWLSKQEFAVPRVIARVNNSRNEWLFDASWGVDVHVSTPALITSLVDEAVEVGSVVHLMDIAHGKMQLVEVTLDDACPAILASQTLDDINIPGIATVVVVVRAEQPLPPKPDLVFQPHDHVVLLVRTGHVEQVESIFTAN